MALSSSSSSSSGCCSLLYCDGQSCSYFSNWSFSGFSYRNSDNCRLYVSLDVVGLYQQVAIYKDSSMSSLVALGQRLISSGSGSITLVSKNSSGLSGSVTWNGTQRTFPNYLILDCLPFSSSSSLSLSESSSTSSESSLSSSSSSSLCCSNPGCFGSACVHFSGWTLSGSTKSNTDNCTLYLDFDYVSAQQRISVYKNIARSLASLVAEGQGAAGIITLSQRNASGLTGSVVWDGTPVYYPSASVLDCDFSSSSSSSTTSSSSHSSYSTSSVSSVSSSSSNSSSTSSQSSSSTSNSSSSSSSSVDSWSSSSESEGNVSTSSSSSFGGWNKTKPLVLGMSAINGSGIINRLAQTITIESSTYSIGKVFCYFYGPFGIDTSYTIHLDIYTCNDNGEPQTLINSQTLAGSSITNNGWYSFTVNLDGSTPSNKYISFVIWQENGNEDNYVLWGYSNDTNSLGTKALFSSDGGGTWTEQSGVVRSLKIVGNFNAYDLVDFRIVSPSAEQDCTTHDVNGGTNDGVKLVAGEYQYGTSKLVINNAPIIASFVIDSSGSMGWNDRFSGRQGFVNGLISRIKQRYPNGSLFDVVKFGSQSANTSSANSSMGFVSDINIDLTVPERTTYSFVVSAADASQGAVYSNNSHSFTISNTINDGIILTCLGNVNSDIYDSGDLTKVSGTGDAVISYSSYQTASISNQIVGYGFKSFEEGHPCNVSRISIGTFSPDISLVNWKALSPNGTTELSLGTNGPKSGNSVDFVSHSDLTLRRSVPSYSLTTTNITSNVSKDDVIVNVSNAASFSIGDQIDILDADIGSFGHTITNVSGNIITFTPGAVFNVKSWVNGGGIVQSTSIKDALNIVGTTSSIQIKDPISSRNIVFFLQTINGLSMEWDIQPFKDWYINNLYWLDETALLPVTVIDSDGNPFPDGTKIILYVNNYPEDSNNSSQILSYDLVKNAVIGNTKIYLESTTGFTRNTDVDIINNSGNVQTCTIVEIGQDINGKYLKLDPPLIYNFNIANGSRIIKSQNSQDISNAGAEISASTLLSSNLNLVDVTPIYTGESLDPSLLKPYDMSPVSPSTTYESLNLDREHVRNNITDIPIINGKAVVRILPITEDNLKTVNEKNEEANRIVRLSSQSSYAQQLEQSQGDVSSMSNSVSNSIEGLTTTTTTLPLSQGSDYDIDNPIYLSGGTATASMTSYATDLEEISFNGIRIPGVDPSLTTTLLAKKYDIYPAIVSESINGILAKQYLNPFAIYFTPPVNIYSEYDGTDIDFVVIDKSNINNCEIFSGYTTSNMKGVYATDDGFTFNYIITDKYQLPARGKLKIRVYSNTSVDLSEVARQGKAISRQDLNVILPKTSTVSNGQITISQPLSNIDSWRQSVESNQASQTIEDTDEDFDNASQNVRKTIISQAKQDMEDAGYINNSTSSVDPSVFEYYNNPWEWTKATQYGILQETTIDVVNGKATFTLPSSDVPSLVMVQASYYFGDSNQYESIRSDVVAVANPIDIGGISPIKIKALGGNTNYEIGTAITWKGQPINDNVSVSFDPSKSIILPSVSKTDNGWAGGVYLGPHSVVVMTCSDDENCPCKGVYENIVVTVSYMGFTYTTSRQIEWTGEETPEQINNATDFYFYVQEDLTNLAYADGNSQFNMTADLDDVYNEAWIESDYPLDGNNRNRMMGFEQDENNTPNKILVYTELTKYQSQSSWLSPITYFNISGLNRNIGHQQPSISDNPFKENLPWVNNIRIFSRYKYNDINNVQRSRFGTGVSAYPYEVFDEFGNSVLIIPYVQSNFVEPLSIAVSLESYNEELIRDGISSPNIIAEIKWEGNPINGKFTKNKGQKDETIIDYPFPNVTFEAGTCYRSNTVKLSNDPVIYGMADTRNIVGGCLTIASHPDVSLNSYSAVSSLSRTDIYNDGNSRHTHACTVNSDGNGITTSTILVSGANVTDHTHTIANYAALSSGSPAHVHNLRCVAIVSLDPIINANVNIAINAYVVYDPTGCQPYSSTTTSLPTTFEHGNRMMFATLYLNSHVINRSLIVTMDAALSKWTSRTITETSKAFNIVVDAKFSAYSIEDYTGHWVTIPERVVPDGTRVIFDIDTFKPLSDNTTSDIFVVRPDAVRKYMYIRVKATVYAEDLEGTADAIIVVQSNLQWIPMVKGLLFDPTADDIYLSQAIAQIGSIGSSQIYDAVKEASQRIIQFQTDNVAWKNAKKAIFLLTDGDENTSEYSLQQSIDNVNYIDGNCKVPVIPVRLGFAYGSDDVLMAQYSSQTCGRNFYLINPSATDITSVLDDVVTSGIISKGFNHGTHINTIDLGKNDLFSNVSIDNLTVPSGSRVLFRSRYSSDNATWSSWTEWYDSSIIDDFGLNIQFKGRYFQYEIHLYGNENFESPELYAGATLCYYDAQTFTVFFQPISLDMDSDEYLASIHITHKATISATSVINYGFTQVDSVDISDYYSVTRPWINSDRHTIILTRYNEMCLTDNYQKYRAINGGWSENSTIEVYRISDNSNNGVLVDSKDYAVNTKTGDITFYSVQKKTDKIMICVYFDPSFRIACNITNYGPNPVVVDHIGLMYNISKRIPRDNQGNIINSPISSRL